MPMIVPVGFATITALCVYEVDIRWSVDFRGGNVHLTWRLKRVVEPEFWCSFALTDGISVRIADKSLWNRSQLLQAGRPWQFLLSLFLCTDLWRTHRLLIDKNCRKQRKRWRSTISLWSFWASLWLFGPLISDLTSQFSLCGASFPGTSDAISKVQKFLFSSDEHTFG